MPLKICIQTNPLADDRLLQLWDLLQEQNWKTPSIAICHDPSLLSFMKDVGIYIMCLIIDCKRRCASIGGTGYEVLCLQFGWNAKPILSRLKSGDVSSKASRTGVDLTSSGIRKSSQLTNVFRVPFHTSNYCPSSWLWVTDSQSVRATKNTVTDCRVGKIFCEQTGSYLNAVSEWGTVISIRITYHLIIGHFRAIQSKSAHDNTNLVWIWVLGVLNQYNVTLSIGVVKRCWGQCSIVEVMFMMKQSCRTTWGIVPVGDVGHCSLWPHDICRSQYDILEHWAYFCCWTFVITRFIQRRWNGLWISLKKLT